MSTVLHSSHPRLSHSVPLTRNIAALAMNAPVAPRFGTDALDTPKPAAKASKKRSVFRQLATGLTVLAGLFAVTSPVLHAQDAPQQQQVSARKSTVKAPAKAPQVTSGLDVLKMIEDSTVSSSQPAAARAVAESASQTGEKSASVPKTGLDILNMITETPGEAVASKAIVLKTKPQATSPALSTNALDILKEVDGTALTVESAAEVVLPAEPMDSYSAKLDKILAQYDKLAVKPGYNGINTHTPLVVRPSAGASSELAAETAKALGSFQQQETVAGTIRNKSGEDVGRVLVSALVTNAQGEIVGHFNGKGEVFFGEQKIGLVDGEGNIYRLNDKASKLRVGNIDAAGNVRDYYNQDVGKIDSTQFTSRQERGAAALLTLLNQGVSKGETPKVYTEPEAPVAQPVYCNSPVIRYVNNYYPYMHTGCRPPVIYRPYYRPTWIPRTYLGAPVFINRNFNYYHNYRPRLLVVPRNYYAPLIYPRGYVQPRYYSAPRYFSAPRYYSAPRVNLWNNFHYNIPRYYGGFNNNWRGGFNNNWGGFHHHGGYGGGFHHGFQHHFHHHH